MRTYQLLLTAILTGVWTPPERTTTLRKIRQLSKTLTQEEQDRITCSVALARIDAQGGTTWER
ncbi:MAG: hypothetical protein U1D99_00640 [Candidatus Omnitrophota bacterium]|nr:hypothetical protein [Candidatus Omnitrophota bacterium]